MWKIVNNPELDRKLGRWPKKYRRELINVINNLDTLLKAFNDGVKVEQAKRLLNFVHGKYPLGIISVDQRGKGSSLKQARLYVLADEDEKVVYGLTIGDKDSQGSDVKFCREWAERHIKQKENSK